MTKVFRASNGVVVERAGVKAQELWLSVGGAVSRVQLWECEKEALREFFLHERDQELGRWRWPENPEYVAYDLGVRVVRIAHEPTGNSWDLDEFSLPNHIVGGRQSWHRTAQAYFAAHPLPKPWHDAQHGEVWALTVDGKEDAFKLHGDLFRTGNLHDIVQTDRHITAGRRIWPEN